MKIHYTINLCRITYDEEDGIEEIDTKFYDDVVYKNIQKVKEFLYDNIHNLGEHDIYEVNIFDSKGLIDVKDISSKTDIDHLL
jgi:hypothetical protein